MAQNYPTGPHGPRGSHLGQPNLGQSMAQIVAQPKKKKRIEA